MKNTFREDKLQMNRIRRQYELERARVLKAIQDVAKGRKEIEPFTVYTLGQPHSLKVLPTSIGYFVCVGNEGRPMGIIEPDTWRWL